MSHGWIGALVLSILLVARGDAQEPQPVLERVPAELVTAEAGRWKDWNSKVPPPESVRATFIEAVRAYLGGHLPLALGRLYAVLDELPEYPPALQQMGVIYFRLRRYGDAAYAFERFLVHAPHEVPMTRALGHAYYSLGRYDEAAEHYALVLKSAPKMIEALRGAALSAWRLGAIDEALQGLRDVVALDPEHADAHAWLARILYDEDKAEEALPFAERARDLGPFEPRPWYLLSQILIDLDREDDAETARERFSVLDRVSQEVRYLEGQLLFDPVQPEMCVRLAEEWRKVGNVAGLRAAVERLQKIAPKNVDANVYALDAFVAAGDKDAAARAALALETNCADSAVAWRRLMEYYARMRNRAKEIEAGERYRRLTNAGG